MSGESQTPVSANPAPPLDDVMLAMDVVDTLRHQEAMVERELSVEQRDEQLLNQLRSIYHGQGIDVSDQVLMEGLRALKEERFAYRPPPDTFSVRLARWYVKRDKWLPPLATALALAAVAAVAYFLLVARPAAVRRASLPSELEARREAVVELAAVPEAKQTAERLRDQGQQALESGHVAGAQQSLDELKALEQSLAREYELRIVSRPSERSGVIRTPDANPDAENYYIIVEAIAPDDSVLTLPVRSEEDGSTSNVNRWGMRVNRDVYDRVAADKMDDGIIQDNRFGVKRRGYLTPEYLFDTTGASITSW